MRLRVDLIPRPPYGESAVVMIDVLRATTSITILLERGAREVWVTPRVSTARQAAREGDLLLGEREGIPPEGFHYGTSPVELEKLDVAGRRVIYTSDNLPIALNRVDRNRVYLAGFRNAAALLEKLIADDVESVAVVCAGFRGAEALDDALAAGFVARGLRLRLGGNLRLGDAARLAASLLDAYANPVDGLWTSASGRFLNRLGYGDDLAAASLIDVSRTLPVLDRVRRIEGTPLYRFVASA
ncbi:2-phosphosulfolactate phosphatase [Oceanithermus sp.]